MREYARVMPTFWIRGTGKRLRGKKDAQVLAFYLMAGPHVLMTGLFHITLATMSAETGLNEKETRAALKVLSDERFAFFDEENETAWVPAMAEIQVGESLPATEKRLRGKLVRELKPFRHHRFYAEFFNRYADLYELKSLLPAPVPPIEPDWTGLNRIEGEPQSKSMFEKNIEGEAQSPCTALHCTALPSTAPAQLAVDSVPPPANPKADPVVEVYEHYVQVWREHHAGGNPPKLDDKRRRLLRARLKDFPVETLKRAAEGIYAARWHVENKHATFEVCYRDAGQVERFSAEPERPSGTIRVDRDIRGKPMQQVYTPPVGPKVDWDDPAYQPNFDFSEADEAAS